MLNNTESSFNYCEQSSFFGGRTSFLSMPTLIPVLPPSLNVAMCVSKSRKPSLRRLKLFHAALIFTFSFGINILCDWISIIRSIWHTCLPIFETSYRCQYPSTGSLAGVAK
jgi:hypothetical protein